MSSGFYFLRSWRSAKEIITKVVSPLPATFLHLTAEKQKKVQTDKNWEKWSDLSLLS